MIAGNSPIPMNLRQLTLPAILLLAACGSSPDPLEPPVPPGGVLEIRVEQSGLLLNRELSVVVNGGPPVRVPNIHQEEGGWLKLYVPVGTYDVELTGVAANCTVDDGSRVTAKVGRQDPTGIDYRVRCAGGSVLGGRAAAYIVPGDWSNSQLWLLSPDGSRRSAGLDADDYAWSSDGARIVSQLFPRVTVASISNPAVVETVPLSGGVYAMAWAPDRNAIALQRRAVQCVVRVVEGPGWESHREYPCGDDPLYGRLAWAPDGRQLAVGAGASRPTVRLITLSNGDVREVATLPEKGPLQGLDWSPDGTKLVITAVDEQRVLVVVLLDLATGAARELARFLTDSNEPWGSTLQWSPDGQSVLVGPVLESAGGAGHPAVVMPIASPSTWRPLMTAPSSGAGRVALPRGGAGASSREPQSGVLGRP